VRTRPQQGQHPGEQSAFTDIRQRERGRKLSHLGTVPFGSTTGRGPARERKETLVVVQAYILIQTEVGKAASVARAVSDISGVLHAEDVTGPYDVIARVEAANVDELGKLVIARIQDVPGITRTLTCTVVHI
jgi:DNA-binding Lrp family transcriptional regulator